MTRLTDDGGAARNARLEDLFARVMDFAPADRAPIIAQECAGDADLRARLERLLAAHDGAERVLPTPPIEGLAPDSGSFDRDPLLGETVGMFRVERQVGAGGMGTVYEATQESPKRRVALKVMRAGLVAKGAAQRFRAEAEALGALEHPHIARIYEAGVALTKVGRLPYFAMEFISGRTLLEHAKARTLDAASRVALFVSVCDAVEHAHRRGIIHRDLKPANVLVGDDGEPKVLDFGVARLTASDLPASSLHTEAGQLLGTLQYMSPEQASGDPLAIDTRSDVYSLGIVLYELLSGVLPYDVSTSTLLQAAQIIREHEPRPLGDVVNDLRGDLETITRKTIEKRPEMRYQSAGELAADLRRFLSHEPISARPPSATYYLRKFVRRNKALSIGAAATLLTLLLGVVGTSIGLKRAVDARRLADKSAAESALNAARSEINEYGANINAAFASLRAGDLTTARSRLDAADPKFRAWEWQYVDAQLDQSVRTLRVGAGHFVSGLALSPDESLLACSSGDRLEVYDLATGKLFSSRTNAGLGTNGFGTLAWSPDGTRLLVSLAHAKNAAILDAVTLEPVLMLDGMKSEVTSVEWSPDGTRLAIGEGFWKVVSAEDRTCTIRNAETGMVERVLRDLPWRAGQTRWLDDGRSLLVGTGRGSVVFDSADWSCRDVPRDDTPEPDQCAAWSPDGKRLSVSRHDTLRVLDADTLNTVWSMPIVHGLAGQVVFSSDGASLVFAINDGLTVLDATSGALRRTLRGINGNVFHLVASRRSDVVWTGGSDGSVKEWSLDAIGDVLEVQARENATPSRDFSIVAHSSPILGQDGTGPMTVRDGRTGQPIREFHLGDPIDGGSEVRISPDKRCLIRAQLGPILSVLDMDSGKRWQRRLGTGQGTGAVEITPDSRLVLHNERTHLRCFTLPTLEPSDAWGSHESPYRKDQAHWGLAIAPDGETVVIDVDGGDLLILRQSEPRQTQIHVFDTTFRELSYSPDGRWLAAERVDGMVAVLNTATWRIVARYDQLPMPARDLCFDPKGTRLFASQLDGTIRILGLFTLPDSPDPRLIEVGALRAGDYWMMRLAMSDDGTRLMAATAWPANRYFIWDARPQSFVLGRTAPRPNANDAPAPRPSPDRH